MKILVTGGAGYIGSHTSVELLQAGYDIIVLDNFSNSSPKSVEAIRSITGKTFPFYHVDLRNRSELEKVFREQAFQVVIHFAGLKSVSESSKRPLDYYDNNISGTLNLLQLMNEYHVKAILFSSSATIYGTPQHLPLVEEDNMCERICTRCPYGTTKLFIEKILMDTQTADPSLSVTILRYFNPIGAHESGMIGENPKGIPNNLLPYVAQVASGKLEKIHVFGNDYPTSDGTGVRDYIHVVDLAIGHVKAIEKCSTIPGVHMYNLGTGHPVSVFEVIREFEHACGKKLPVVIEPRRAGDVAECYADPTKAKTELGWVATRDLADMCRDSWRWTITHPEGFDS